MCSEFDKIVSGIVIWEFENAPSDFKSLSKHGGDEDGIAFVPKGVQIPWWLSKLWDIYGDPQIIDIGGNTLIIWAHS